MYYKGCGLLCTQKVFKHSNSSQKPGTLYACTLLYIHCTYSSIDLSLSFNFIFWLLIFCVDCFLKHQYKRFCFFIFFIFTNRDLYTYTLSLSLFLSLHPLSLSLYHSAHTHTHSLFSLSLYTRGVQHNWFTGPKFLSPFLKGPHNSSLNNYSFYRIK